VRVTGAVGVVPVTAYPSVYIVVPVVAETLGDAEPLGCGHCAVAQANWNSKLWPAFNTIALPQVATCGSAPATLVFSLRISTEAAAVPAWFVTVSTGGPTTTHEDCAVASTWAYCTPPIVGPSVVLVISDPEVHIGTFAVAAAGGVAVTGATGPIAGPVLPVSPVGQTT
jgi:hypothetical protein